MGLNLMSTGCRRPLNPTQKLLILDAPGLVSKLTFLLAGFSISQESQPHSKRKHLEADNLFQDWQRRTGPETSSGQNTHSSLHTPKITLE